MRKEKIAGAERTGVRRTAAWAGRLTTLFAAAASAGPVALRAAANRWLKSNDAIRGHIDSLRWNPLTGRIHAGGVHLVFFDKGDPAGALQFDRLSANVSLRDLLRGHIVVDADLVAPAGKVRLPRANAGDKKTPSHSPRPSFNRVADVIHSLPPLRVNRLTVSRGEVHLQNIPGQNGTDVRLEDLSVELRNFQTREWMSVHRAASLSVHATAMGSGVLRAHITADPLSFQPFFNADFQLEGLQLRELADLIRRFAKLDVEDGVFNVYVEAAGANGAVKGYAKPLVDHLKVARAPDEGRLRAAVVKAAARLFGGGADRQIAARVPFEGPLDKPAVSRMAALKTLLRNAFGRPIAHGLDGGVAATQVAGEVRSGHLLAPPKPIPRWRMPFRLLRETASRFSKDNCTRMGASLSYYTMFSIAPLLLLATGVAGLVFGEAAVEGKIVEQLGGVMGPGAASTLQSMIEAARKPAASIAATVISVVTLGLGASAVLIQLKKSLNQIWNTHPEGGFFSLVKNRLLAFSVVLAIGFLLLVSLAVSASIAALSDVIRAYLTLPPAALELVNLATSGLIITLLFAVLYRLLPDARVEWKDVWVGAVVTTILFVIGKQLLGLYLGRGATSAYGAASSVLVMLVWVYYSAQIFYFGAEFTKVYSDWFGSGARRSRALQFSRR